MKGLLSLAGTGKADYVALQVRRDGDGLHVQGAGPEVNRDYGVSANLACVDPKILTWVDKNAHTGSLAGTGKLYAVVQAQFRDGVVHFQGKGTKLNRDYGIAFNDGTNKEIVAFIKAFLAAPEPTPPTPPAPKYSVTLA